MKYEKEIKKELERWNELKEKGGFDPFWPDGTNMNLVRNHVIYYLSKMREEGGTQISMFETTSYDESCIPPKVNENYMATDRQIVSWHETTRELIFMKG